MKAEGSAQAVAGTNEPRFAGFATKSGRDIASDLERAHRPVASPLGPPVTKEQIRKAAARAARQPKQLDTPPAPDRQPVPAAAPAARLPATPDRTETEHAPAAAPTPSNPPGRGQTTQRRRSRHAALYPAMVDAYLAGATIPAIGARYGISRGVVRNALDTWHVVRRDDRRIAARALLPTSAVAELTPEQAAAIVEAVDAGYSLVAIAQELIRRSQQVPA